MATTQQLEAIAARMFPDRATSEVLSQQNLFLARVMSAGDWRETNAVLDHFGKPALRGVLDTPPAKIFDRPSWNLWHSHFGLEAPEMPDDFFTVYPWFKNRAVGERTVTADMINHLPNYTGPVRSCDEFKTA